MKKINFLQVSLCLLLAVSCAAKGKGDTLDASNQQTKAVVHPLGMNDEVYDALIQKSFVTLGNTSRLKSVIEKLRAGKKVYVAALGGSVTEGAGPASYKDGYAYQFCNKLKAAYTPDNGANVVFNGAGLSGTPSMLGLIRYQSDVVEVLGHTPDLLIIEFAVNDDGGSENARAFEALVRDALLADENTAVIALYSAATYGNTKAVKNPIANFYRIPQVDVLETVKAGVSAGNFKQEQYYTDNVHPTKEGHEIQADCLMNILAKTDEAPAAEAYPVPEGFYTRSGNFSGLIRITGDNDDVKITEGGWSGNDSNTQTIKKTNKGNFPENWYKAASAENNPFKMEITCRNLLFTYKVQGNWLSEKFGKAEVYVDGKLFATYDGGAANGWNNCETRLLINEKTASKHTIEVKMADGDAKKGFTIVAMGYVK